MASALPPSTGFSMTPSGNSITALTVLGGSRNRCPWGEVVLARDRRQDLIVIKKYDLDKIKKKSEFQELVECISNEASMMRQFQHANLLPCLNSFICGSEAVLVFPWMTFGSVRDIIDQHFPQGLPELAISYIVRDIALALRYLHERFVVHRSIKCSHILISSCGTAKLSGMRSACSLIEPGQEPQDRYDYPVHIAKPNIRWLSPEFLHQNLLGYNQLTDIYSLGVACVEAANGLVPFSGMPATLILLEKLRGAAPRLLDESTYEDYLEELNNLDLPDSEVRGEDSVYASRSFSQSFHDFVEDCCQLDPTNRLSAKRIQNHQFIRQQVNKKTEETIQEMLQQLNQDPLQNAKDEEERRNNLILSKDVINRIESMDIDQVQWDF